MNELGNYLKELRGKRSLREVQKGTGISHTYLSTLEKGYDPRTKKERKPTPEVLRKLALYYEVPYVVLMTKARYVDVNGAVQFGTLAEAFGFDFLTHGDDVTDVYNHLEKYGGTKDQAKLNNNLDLMRNMDEFTSTGEIEFPININYTDKNGVEHSKATTSDDVFDLFYLLNMNVDIYYKRHHRSKKPLTNEQKQEIKTMLKTILE